MKTAFLFPGQGAQYVGMAGALAAAQPAAKALFDRASAVLGYDLLDLCVNGPVERLNATDISQPAIFVSSLAALESLKTSEPDLVSSVAAAAGLSLGEYTALAFAGALTFEDGVRVVQARGRAMQDASEKTPSGMISALLLDETQVQSVVEQARLQGRIWTANFLCPGNTVLSGDLAGIEAADQLIQNAGGKPIRLSVAGAFHTELMKPADEQLNSALAKIDLNPCRIPVWTNVDAQAHVEPSEIRPLLVKQVLNPVKWEETIRNMLASGIDRFHEIGPGRVLAGLLKRIGRKIECRNTPA